MACLGALLDLQFVHDHLVGNDCDKVGSPFYNREGQDK